MVKWPQYTFFSLPVSYWRDARIILIKLSRKHLSFQVFKDTLNISLLDVFPKLTKCIKIEFSFIRNIHTTHVNLMKIKHENNLCKVIFLLNILPLNLCLYIFCIFSGTKRRSSYKMKNQPTRTFNNSIYNVLLLGSCGLSVQN